MKKRKQYYTIVFADTNEPVTPIDCTQGDCEGMLVYCTKESAEMAMDHQYELCFDREKEKLKVVTLGQEECCK